MRTTVNSAQTLYITMGCPAGIGPEILVRLFAGETQWRPDPAWPTVVVGDLGILQQAAQVTKRQVRPTPWQPGHNITAGEMPVLQVDSPDLHDLKWGQPTEASGRAMARYIEQTVALLGSGQGSALITCPISKFSLQAAGYPYPGHTEMLAALTNTREVHMMMAGPRLKVVLVTIHEALQRVPTLLCAEKISACIGQTHTTLQRDFGCATPRIAVVGLNPHGGEQGLFGDEETRIIQPAVEAAKRALPQAELSGPWPPDTVFCQAAQGKFDAVIAMYHDQGLIPFKLLHFADGVNVTLGLPIIRTSVDHGTAYDIAGKGLAKADSLAAALVLAQNMAANRMRHEC
jgi:4-hydroxythreonine-4-phosphate dehydrogenase